jgi:ATP-binding cassette subfamily C protein
VLAVPTSPLLVLLFVFARLMPRVTSIYERAQAFAGTLPAFAAIEQLESRCRDAAEPTVDRSEPITLGRDIRLELVTFDYRGDGVSPALADVTLSIEAGATTAVVGPSGAGKSTLADLVMGLVTPNEGRVLVDGQPLDARHLAAWRAQIGYVAQETFLFHDTVRANLLWARPEATEADLWLALRQAAADQFVATLPRGLDTVIGDRGVLLSGGERQRLSLARALVRRPKLLILDEATSSLDSENEVRIQRAVDGLQHALTIVVITHRLTTIRAADVIHVIEGGRLIESGSWMDLRRRMRGRFRDLCEAQGIDDAPRVPDLRVVTR